MSDMKSTAQAWPSTDSKIPFASENLRPLYQLCEKQPAFGDIFDLYPRIRLVIDSNIVVEEILFVATRRTKPTARSILREVLDSGVLITVAPIELREEIERHIPRLAKLRRVSEEPLRKAWSDLQTQIDFQKVRSPTNFAAEVVDRYDLPFVDLYLESGAVGVLTRDADISAMGAKTINPEVLRPLREYARAKAPEVGLRIGGV